MMFLNYINQRRSKVEQTIYQENGYSNRKEYLHSLAEGYGVDISVVVQLASLLGEDEDFDGLVSSLQDIEDGMYDF